MIIVLQESIHGESKWLSVYQYFTQATQSVSSSQRPQFTGAIVRLKLKWIQPTVKYFYSS